MRGIDRRMSEFLFAHWVGIEVEGVKLCPLLADLDRMLKYFDEIELKPGYALNPCPECGEEHRWAMLKGCLMNALAIRPPDTSKLLGTVDKSLEPVRGLYGGEEGFREMQMAAMSFFAGKDRSGEKPYSLFSHLKKDGEPDAPKDPAELARLKALRRNTRPRRSEKLRPFLDEPGENET
ncbi:MAG: hypothetical protein AMXMBFR31_29530 [Candidatus Desulfobacillus denitrificans]